MKLGEHFVARLILAVVSTALEEVALYAIWRWGLPYLDVDMPLYALIIVMAVWGTYAITNFIIVTRAMMNATVVGLPTMVGSIGKVVRPLAPEGLVRIKGELWTAESGEGDIVVGKEVTVVREEGLKLYVRRGGRNRPPAKEEAEPIR